MMAVTKRSGSDSEMSRTARELPKYAFRSFTDSRGASVGSALGFAPALTVTLGVAAGRAGASGTTPASGGVTTAGFGAAGDAAAGAPDGGAVWRDGGTGGWSTADIVMGGLTRISVTRGRESASGRHAGDEADDKD